MPTQTEMAQITIVIEMISAIGLNTKGQIALSCALLNHAAKTSPDAAIQQEYERINEMNISNGAKHLKIAEMFMRHLNEWDDKARTRSESSHIEA